jgi:hypothetical protein
MRVEDKEEYLYSLLHVAKQEFNYGLTLQDLERKTGIPKGEIETVLYNLGIRPTFNGSTLEYHAPRPPTLSYKEIKALKLKPGDPNSEKEAPPFKSKWKLIKLWVKIKE